MLFGAIWVPNTMQNLTEKSGEPAPGKVSAKIDRSERQTEGRPYNSQDLSDQN